MLEPLHAAVVHVPVALALLMPVVTILVGLALLRGFLPPRAWAGVVILQSILVASAMFALETGEDQEEKVLPYVPAGVVEEHEMKATLFARVTFLTLACAAAGLLRGRIGSLTRVMTLPLCLLVGVLGVQVGHSGGELVYRHGAAAAYHDKPSSATPVARPGK